MAVGERERGSDAVVSGPQEADRVVVLHQLPFSVVAAVVVGGLLAADPTRLTDPLLVAAILVTIGMSAAAALVPWHRIDHRWAATMPAAQILAVGLAHIGGVDVVVGVALPVLWLSRAYGAVGTVASVLAAVTVSWAPYLLGQPVTESTLTRLLVEPAVFASVGAYTYLAERRSQARQKLLEAQGAVLERTLDDSRRQWRMLEGVLNTIAVGVVVLGADGRVVVRNRAQGGLCPPTPHVGEPADALGPLELYAEDRRTPLTREDSALLRAARGERVDREVVWWRDDDLPDGWRALGVTASPLHDEQGRWDGAVVVYQDLTPEFTAMAQQADFIAAVSHDLRTPLTSILGFAELLVDEPGIGERERGQVLAIERNSRRLLHLIGDILTAAQIAHGGLRLELWTVDLCDVVREVLDTHGPAAKAKALEVRDELEGPIFVRGDVARITEAVDNVVANAVKYSREGGRVTVGADRGDGLVVLRVRDEGVGIPLSDQRRVFDRFYRAEAVRGGTVQGTGLGLYITQEIVRAHGGHVELVSEAGVGTEVRIILSEEGAP
jgi:signal transduction histidine kinase